jgi:hypothetical protein
LIVSPNHRRQWARYFLKANIKFAFFSAYTEIQIQEAEAISQQGGAAPVKPGTPGARKSGRITPTEEPAPTEKPTPTQEPTPVETKASASAAIGRWGAAVLEETESPSADAESEADGGGGEAANTSGSTSQETALFLSLPVLASDRTASKKKKKLRRVSFGSTTVSSKGSEQPPVEHSQPAVGEAGEADVGGATTSPRTGAEPPTGGGEGETATVAAVPEPTERELEDSCFIHSSETLLELLFDRAKAAAGDSVKVPTIGMVGYPNVGKSSTINALCAQKCVPVSSTPGRTRHFQTILLGEMTLCDCPGLVFPNFANTKAEMICNGILPIDQMTEHVPALTHVCRTIEREALEKAYGISIIKPALGDPNASRPPTAHELVDAYGLARGFMNGRGEANGPRCARQVASFSLFLMSFLRDHARWRHRRLCLASLYFVSQGRQLSVSSRFPIHCHRPILKDYVDGEKLRHCAMPPHEVLDELEQLERPQLAGAEPDTFGADHHVVGTHAHNRKYANSVDQTFFSGDALGAIAKDRASLMGKEKIQGSSKKHNKKGRKEKARRLKTGQRSGTNGYAGITQGAKLM